MKYNCKINVNCKKRNSLQNFKKSIWHYLLAFDGIIVSPLVRWLSQSLLAWFITSVLRHYLSKRLIDILLPSGLWYRTLRKSRKDEQLCQISPWKDFMEGSFLQLIAEN